MLTQENKEDIALEILEFCKGSSGQDLETTVDNILQVLEIDKKTVYQLDRDKITNLIKDYRASKSLLLESVIQDIYDVCWTNSIKDSLVYDPYDSFIDLASSPFNNQICVSNAISNPITLGHAGFNPSLKLVKTKAEFYQVISHLIDTKFIHSYDMGSPSINSNATSTYWYTAEIAVNGTILLFTYHEDSLFFYLSPEEIALGFLAAAYNNWTIVAMQLKYDILSNRLVSI